MNKVLSVVFSFYIIFFASCSGLKVVAEYDKNFDFNTLKTFRIYEGKTIQGDELANHPLLRNRVVKIIIEELENKGYSYLPEGDTDFLVVLHAGSAERMEMTANRTPDETDPWWGPYGERVETEQYDKATLIIDLINPGDNNLLWRGTMTGIVREEAGQDLEKMRETAAEIFENFPPEK